MDLRITELSTQKERQIFFKECCNRLAEANFVVINSINSVLFNTLVTQFGPPSANGILIACGNIYYSKQMEEAGYVEHELVFHELLHVLSVPIEYRQLMNHDTEKSYKLIRNKFNDNMRVSTESAVLGAQAILYDTLNATGWIGGRFFTGHIREIKDGFARTDVKDEWKIRGHKLLKLISVPF